MVVHRYVVVFYAVRIGPLRRKAQSLAVRGHRTNPGANGLARLHLGAADGQCINSRDGYRVEVRVTGDGIGFAVILGGQRGRAFLAVGRDRLERQRQTLDVYKRQVRVLFSSTEYSPRSCGVICETSGTGLTSTTATRL